MVGGSAKGDRWLSLSSTGEYTVVASANRGVRGTLSEAVDVEELDGLRSLVVVNGSGRFFSLNATASIRICRASNLLDCVLLTRHFVVGSEGNGNF